MKENYTLRNRTPESSDCIGCIGCPATYELTPKELLCCVGACPAVYEKESSYLIVGKQVSSTKTKELGLEGKVGEGETMVEVPRALIDGMER